MLERLWNGWRSSYVSSLGVEPDSQTDDDETDGQGSVFTQILSSGLSDDDTNIVHRGPTCFAILNAYPYGTGHLLVLPYREIARLEDLDPVETIELWATVTDAVGAVTRAYAPDGVNVGTQPRTGGRRLGQRAPARARRSEMDRRWQLHDRDRQHAHAAGATDRHRRQIAGGVEESGR